jgi:3-oxoacyl-[acyl-carrier-protein] synthase-3
MGAELRSIGAYIPERRMSNDELAKIVDTSDEWIRSHTGIGFRHIAADGDAASDLGVRAATQALERAQIDADQIDMILCATASGDHVGFPSTACLIQDQLGARNAGAMDLIVGCTGFVYGLETAKGLIASGSAKHVILVGSEVLTRIMDWTDRNTCVLFGDGAGAAVVSQSDNGNGILDSFLRSDGSRAMALARKTGGTRTPFRPGETPEADTFIQMEGRAVYNFAVQVIVDTIQTLLERNKITIDDLKFIVPHQANVRIIEAAAKRAKIPMEKFYLNIEEYANTSAATIPIALNELYEKQQLERGDLFMTVGFGAGLTFGGNLVRW